MQRKERLIIGPPGCGKTTRLARLCEEFARQYGSDSILVCSLTRTAAQAVARKRVDGHAIPVPRQNIGTLHAFAYRGLECSDVADSGKNLLIWNEWVTDRGFAVYRVSEGSGVDLDDTATEGGGGNTIGDECLQAYNIMRARIQDRSVLPEHVQRWAELWEEFKAEMGLPDFSDLLDLALDLPCAPGAPKVILVDEAQDFSYQAVRLLQHWANHECVEHFIMVGDPLQSLFHWSGGDPEAMTSPDIPADQVEVLEQSYRVPRRPHAYARRVIEAHQKAVEAAIGKEIVYRPRIDRESRQQAEGALRVLPQATWKYPLPAIQDALSHYLGDEQFCSVRRDYQGEPVPQDVMFIASCSHMLGPLIAELRRQGIPFHNPYRESRGDWNPLSVKGMSSAARLINFLRFDERLWGQDVRLWNAKELWAWVEPLEASGLLKRGAKALIKDAASQGIASNPDGTHGTGELALSDLEQWFEDLGEILRMIELQVEGNAYDWFQMRLLSAKRKAMEFPIAICKQRGPETLRRKPRVIVGTMHSLKGAEASATYVFPDLSQAGMNNYNTPGPDRDGVLRAFYVATTRCLDDLILCQAATRHTFSWPPIGGI